MNIGLFAGTIAFIVTTAAGALNVPAQSAQTETAEAATKIETAKEKEDDAKSKHRIKKKVKLHITAYSSSPDETDDSPFITASGKEVEDGIIATNIFPFGTKARIPSLFGKKIFITEDRMHHRFKDRIDIWMPSKEKALKFGKKFAEVEILE